MINLSQTQRLEQRLTPQQILLSTLLQLPLLSLELRIKSELEINPVLEEGEDEELLQENEEIDASEEEVNEVAEELDLHDESNKQSDEEYDQKEIQEAQNDTDLENLINDGEAFEIRIPRDRSQEDYERPEVSTKTLPEHLLEQLRILDLDELEIAIGDYIIWNIRDDGYLDQNLSLKIVAEIFKTDETHVEKVLRKIQRLDPSAVGCRNLRECLMIQMEEKNLQNSIAYAILRDYFDDFKNKRYDKIIAALNISREELQENIDEIIRLNPKPGEGIFDTRSNYIVPDFIVEKVEDKFVISLNDWNVPPLRISNTYKRMLFDKKNVAKEARQYVRKKVESARWFISSIYQRKITMLKVMEAIVEKQYDFFDKGPQHIKPLIMREIAEMIEMDISTVSRVANGKYVQTDFGVFELKYFFNERIETEDGEEISTRKIKNRLKEIIEQEDHQKPLSDDRIAEMLKEEGYPIARRTVAKYREQLQLPVARLRRGV